MNTTPLPDYERPPVVEVVFGIVLKRLEKFFAPHFGAVWDAFRSDYPKCDQKPPLLSQGDNELPIMPRVWFLDASENHIIQVQPDRFIYNWRKYPTGQEYPRYDVVRASFAKCWEKFCDVVCEHNLGDILPLKCELTYVNHIPEGEGWSSLGSLDELFPSIGYRQCGPDALSPKSIHWRTVFALANEMGNLNVNLVDALRQDDEHRLIQLELIARSPGDAMPVESILPWFDSSRQSIVKIFAELTRETVQSEIWGKKQ